MEISNFLYTAGGGLFSNAVPKFPKFPMSNGPKRIKQRTWRVSQLQIERVQYHVSQILAVLSTRASVLRSR